MRAKLSFIPILTELLALAFLTTTAFTAKPAKANARYAARMHTQE